jgi:NAD(P)-dependent dehydrogenase (short-subunit alcohol dehydrogenase family)
MKKRTVLITGACGGIGSVLCQRFVALGDHVLAQDKDAIRLQAMVAEHGVQCSAVHADLTDEPALRAAIQAAVENHGPVDVLVANAGAAESLTLQATDGASWRKDIDLNLNGTYYTVEAVRSAMQTRGKGNIVLIGSVNGMTSLGHPAYSVAKAGLISYTKALAMEFGRFGIRSNMVCPGTVKTQAWQARAEKNPAIFDELKKWYPMADFATPDDIADAVIFLASDSARMITGAILPVDGGLMAGNRVLAQELTQEAI